MNLLKVGFSLLILIIASSCSSPSLTKVSMDKWFDITTSTSLEKNRLSFRAQQYLDANGLDESFMENPEAVIFELAKEIDNLRAGKTDESRKFLSIIIDLCTYAAKNMEEDEAVKYWLSVAFLSYEYFSNVALKPSLSSFYYLGKDEIITYYNRASAEVFKYLYKNDMLFSGKFELPIINGTVKFDEFSSDLPWKHTIFKEFKICYEYMPNNVNVISSSFGVGVPIVGITDAENGFLHEYKSIDIIRLNYPATYVLKFEESKKGEITASPYFKDFYKDETVVIGDRDIPIAKDYSVALVNFLKVYNHKAEIDYLLKPEDIGAYQGVYMLSPYDPNKIPVVLVHGLISDPQSLYQIINTLMLDRKVRENYQFLFYYYATGEPVLLSSTHLRNELLELAEHFNKGESKAKFNEMVLVGYSLGGLVAKMLTLESDGKLLLADNVDKKETFTDITGKSFTVDDLLIFSPLPFIKSVIYIATPHKGADMADWVMTSVVSDIISSPHEFVMNGHKINFLSAKYKNPNRSILVNTSLTNLRTDSKFVKLTNELPHNENIDYHSIIGNDEKDVKGGSDGVVAYWSSHIDYAKSEFVVLSDHHSINRRKTAWEIQRILLSKLPHAVDKYGKLKSLIK